MPLHSNVDRRLIPTIYHQIFYGQYQVSVNLASRMNHDDGTVLFECLYALLMQEGTYEFTLKSPGTRK